MEEIIYSVFGSYGYFVVPIFSALLTSFGIEAVNQYTSKDFTPKIINLLLTIFFSILLIIVFSHTYYTTIPDYVLIFTVNISFATVFYYLVGKRVVIKIIMSIEKRIAKEMDKRIGKENGNTK